MKCGKPSLIWRTVRPKEITSWYVVLMEKKYLFLWLQSEKWQMYALVPSQLTMSLQVIDNWSTSKTRHSLKLFPVLYQSGFRDSRADTLWVDIWWSVSRNCKNKPTLTFCYLIVLLSGHCSIVSRSLHFAAALRFCHLVSFQIKFVSSFQPTATE